METIDLNECTLISSEEYCLLENPEFIGQTRLDSNDMYYMVWKCDGVLYKTYNKL